MAVAKMSLGTASAGLLSAVHNCEQPFNVTVFRLDLIVLKTFEQLPVQPVKIEEGSQVTVARTLLPGVRPMVFSKTVTGITLKRPIESRAPGGPVGPGGPATVESAPGGPTAPMVRS